VVSFPHVSSPKHYMTSPLPHTCYIPCPFHWLWQNHPNIISSGVQITKLPIMQSSPFPSYIVTLRPKYISCGVIVPNILNLQHYKLVGHQHHASADLPYHCLYRKLGCFQNRHRRCARGKHSTPGGNQTPDHHVVQPIVL
jgi:hypothetical protein